jgi:hypothetical protein
MIDPFTEDYIHRIAKSIRDDAGDLFERLNTVDEKQIEAELDQLCAAHLALTDILRHFKAPKLRVVG